MADGSNKQQRANTRYKVAFLAGASMVSLLTGFCFTAFGARAHRGKLKLPTGPGGRVQEYEDPVVLATRALGWGTLYSLVGTGTVALGFVAIWKTFSDPEDE